MSTTESSSGGGTGGPGTGGPDPTVVALGRAVERTVRRIGELDSNMRHLAADVHALARRLTDGDQSDPPDAAAADDPPAVRSWLLATDPDQANLDLADLVEWVGRVYLRYARADLSACWLWHPEVIEELWWLRCAHADAYHPENGSWLRASDWHDRQRTGVERRVNALLGKCDLTRHTSYNGRPADVTDPGPAPLGAHHPAVAAAWTTTRTAGPTPTAQQLTEAEQHQQAKYRSHR